MTTNVNNLRLTVYLEEFWEKSRADKSLPSLEQIIRILNEEASIVDSIFILEASIELGRHSFSVKHMGQDLILLYKDPSEDKTPTRLINNFIQSNKRNLEKVISTKSKIINNIEISIGAGQDLKYRQILLPIGNETSDTVTAIIGGMRCKKNGSVPQYLIR